MTEFRMPSLGADMEKGTIVEWRIDTGDEVKRGDVVALVETDKGIIEVEIWHGGVVESIVIPEGETVAVGTVLATLTGADDAPGRRPRASPRARAVAAELGIDLEAMAADDAITEADVRSALSPQGHRPADSMRTAIARSMTRSKQTIPHYYVSTTVDATPGLEWLRERNESRPVADRVLPVALLLRATALAVEEVPETNGHFVDGRFEPADAVHLGVAISLRGGGLVAPAIMDCQSLTLDEVMQRLSDLVQRARSGRLREVELSSPTLTVTNLGDRGVEAGYGVIVPPQVAIVCFGAIVARPLVIDGDIVPRSTITTALSADHRVSDGHRGGLFLESIASHLQQPEAL